MHFMITGSQGFIGSFLTSSLLEAGHEVSGLDIDSRPLDNRNYRYVQGDILDKGALQEAMRGVDGIIHLAAEHKDVGIPQSRYFEVNVTGTRTVLECASNAGIGKLVFFSSAAVYGRPGKASDEKPLCPATPYGASKLQAEAAVRAWIAEDPSRAAVIIRPTATFGPENYANIYRLISRVCDGKFMWIGKGDNVKSVAYVGNLVAATQFLLDRLEPGLQIYNYSDEPQLRMKQLVDLISKKAQVRVNRFYIPYLIAITVGGVLEVLFKMAGSNFEITTNRLKKFCMHSEHPADKIRSLGFHQKYTLEEGIEKTVCWYYSTKS